MRFVLAILLLASVACSSGETAASTTSAAASGTTTTTQPTTTTEVSTTTSTAAATTSTSATTTTLPEFPAAADSLEHGGDIWAVYLAVGVDYSDPELEMVVELADGYGYFTGVSDIGCDQGAAEALDVDPDKAPVVVGVYFDTEEDARQFVAAFEARGHSVAGVGLVQTYCMD